MPQLDPATYRGQVSWLRSVWRRFYGVRAGDRLPGRTRAMKFRTRKVERSRASAGAYEGRRGEVEGGVGKRRSGRVGSRRARRANRRASAGTWVEGQRARRRAGDRRTSVQEGRKTQVQADRRRRGRRKVRGGRGGRRNRVKKVGRAGKVKRARGKRTRRKARAGGGKGTTGTPAKGGKDAKAKSPSKRGKK